MKYSRYLRKPKTTQEARAGQGEDAAYVRPRRRKSCLPNSWDDILIRSIEDRSWKRKKIRKQWG